MLILVINSGSSSLKYEVCEIPTRKEKEAGYDGPTGEQQVLTAGLIERIGLPDSEIADHAQALDVMAARVHETLNGRKIDAAGHRVVHGGEQFSAPTLVTPEVIDTVENLSALAPLHNPAAVAGLRAMQSKYPDMPQVAVFDTAFHQTMPEEAWRYAVPHHWYENFGIRRYGFHGTSHDLVTGLTADLLGVDRDEFNGIILHLGNGASATAIRDGVSIDTTMGYTPLPGLVMGTRSGDLDPSIITQLITAHGLTGAEIDRVLNKESGLLGLSGSADMRSVLDAAAAGDHAAAVALDVASYRLAKYIGAYHLAVGGAQAITFTAGVGQNSAPFRARVMDRLTPLGISYDEEANQAISDQPRVISTPDSAIAVAVVPTNEELAIARETVAVMQELDSN